MRATGQFIRRGPLDRLVVVVVSLMFLAAACGPKGSGSRGADSAAPLKSPLRLTIVPYEAAQQLSEAYTPMAEFLAKRVGLESGRYIQVADYSGVAAALQSHNVDVAYLSPFSYALASSMTKLHPLAMPVIDGSLKYRGIIFVRADSGIDSLEDLNGKTFAFGDPASTTGYLLPKGLMDKRGIKLKRSYHAGDANVVVAAVEHKRADAGAAYVNVFDVAYRGAPQKTSLMRTIAETEEIPNGIYVARGNMPPGDVEKLKEAFLAMNTDPAGSAALKKVPHDRIEPADDSMFDSIRETARILDLDLTVFDKKKK